MIEVGHQRVEFVGGDVSGAQGDPSQFVALEHVVQVGRVLEQRAERSCAAADERPQGHVAEAAAQLGEFGLLGGDPGFGGDDVGVELSLGVDRLDILLGEFVRLLFEALEFVDVSATFWRCPSTNSSTLEILAEHLVHFSYCLMSDALIRYVGWPALAVTA